MLTQLREFGIRLYKQGAHFDDEFPVWSIMRNERYFLPYFLEHYRALGLRNFIILADQCDSDFIDRLIDEQDVSILLSERNNFGDVVGRQESGDPLRFTTFFKNAISNEFCFSQWHLIVDSDEFLILPPPFSTLAEYSSALEKKGLNGGFAPMVDFYPRTLKLRNFRKEIAPFEGSPYFDSGAIFAFDQRRGLIQIGDGIRGRILRYLKATHMQKLMERGVDIGVYNGPKLHKFPLIKTTESFRRRGDHDIVFDNVAQSQRRYFFESILQNSSVLAHFKFYPELDQKISSALAEGNYFSHSVEYKWLKYIVDNLAEVDLVFAGSRKYKTRNDLIEAGLLPAVLA